MTTASELTGPIKRKALFKKQPLFKKTPSSTSAPQNPNALFSRADSNYKAVVEDAERRIAKRKAREDKRQEEERRKLADGQVVTKRRRLSSSGSSSSSDSDEDDGKAESRGHREQLPTPISPTGPRASVNIGSPRGKALGGPQLSTIDVEIVDLSDDENATASKQDESFNSTASRPSLDQPENATRAKADDEDEDDEDPESDEELAAITRQAKEAVRRKRAEAEARAQAQASSLAQQDGPKPEKATFQLIIESRLPGTTLLSFKVRLDSLMSKARWKWCEENDFASRPGSAHGPADEMMSNDIILMFRGRRVYDINTPLSLGISVDEVGNALIDGEHPMMAGFTDGNIIMHAIRESELDIYVQDWDKTHGRQHAGDEADDEDDAVEEPAVPVVTERSIKIICRARDRKDLKLLVKSSTTIESIQGAYTAQFELEDTDVLVYINGEAQDSECTMEDLEVEDMDVLEIHLRPIL